MFYISGFFVLFMILLKSCVSEQMESIGIHVEKNDFFRKYPRNEEGARFPDKEIFYTPVLRDHV